MFGIIRKTTRLASLGLIGESPKATLRKEQAKLTKAQRKAIERCGR